MRHTPARSWGAAGFLPAALDNRPLFLEEFERMTGQKICLSATPAEYELDRSERVV